MLQKSTGIHIHETAYDEQILMLEGGGSVLNDLANTDLAAEGQQQRYNNRVIETITKNLVCLDHSKNCLGCSCFPLVTYQIINSIIYFNRTKARKFVAFN